MIASNQFGTMTSPPIQVLVNAAPVPAGSLDPSFDPGLGFDQPVTALTLQGDKIVAAGKFGMFDGNHATNLARVFPTGKFDETFNAGTGFRVFFNLPDALIAAPDGELYVGEDFRFFNGIEQRALVRLEGNGDRDRTFAPVLPSGASVGDLMILPNGALLVAGCPDTRCSTGVWRMTPEGAVDSSFRSDPDFPFDSYRAKLAVQRDGKILVGGGAVGSGLLRLMQNGTRDPIFQPLSLPSDPISAILELPDGRILVAARLGTALRLLQENGKLENSSHSTSQFTGFICSRVARCLRRGIEVWCG